MGSKSRFLVTGLIVLAGWLVMVIASPAAAKDALPQLYVPDGQLLNQPLQVYVSATNLDEDATPVLRLVEFYANQNVDYPQTNVWRPFFVAGGQSWTERVSGQTVSREGTLLMFDLTDYQLAAYKSTTRVTPVLSWSITDRPGGKEMTTSVVGKPVYLGKRWVALAWTIVVVGLLVVIICRLCKIKGAETSAEMKHILGVRSLISGPDNYMSLWRTQLVVWTLAVGSMVFFFGVIQLQVPKIPDSLVALMGMSIATGSLSAVAARSQRRDASKDKHGPAKNHRPEFSDLISSYNPDIGAAVLSVPKAQMLFWTGIIIILFVAKSFLTGQLWDVPWEMVALTGVSQAGYVSDKALHGKAANGV